MPEPAPTSGLVVFAKNVERVSAFYQQTLGLEVAETEATHQLLIRSGLELVIHGIPAEIADTIAIGSPPRLRVETPFKPAYFVTDLEAVRAAATRTGGALKPAEDAWNFRGTTVLDGHDPEGNVVQFKQRDDR